MVSAHGCIRDALITGSLLLQVKLWRSCQFGKDSRVTAIDVVFESEPAIAVHIHAPVHQQYRHRAMQSDVAGLIGSDDGIDRGELGRASCRERVCQYV